MPQKINIVGGAVGAGTVGVPSIEQIVDPTFQASRVRLMPDDHLMGGQVLGHYRLMMITGAMTTLAGGVLIASFRYGDPGTVAVVKRISAFAAVTTTFTAGQIIDCDAISVRGWTASDSAGTAVTIGTGNKLRNSMAASRFSTSGDLRVASATAITAGGTKTLEANPFGYAAIQAATTADVGSGGFMGDLFKLDTTGQHPLVYGANEGFNCRVVTTQGAAGVVKIAFVVEWAELIGF